MIEILIAQNKAEVWSFLCQKSKVDLVEFFLNKQFQTQEIWETWTVASWNDLGNYVSSGQDGIFGFDEPKAVSRPAVIWDSASLVLDESSLNYLSKLKQTLLQPLYIVLLKSEVNANLKKLITKFELKPQELTPIEAKIKQNLAKKYMSLNYPDLVSKLDVVVLHHLSALDWPMSILDMIDFLVLSEVSSWSDFIRLSSKPRANIFGFNISKKPTSSEIEVLYELAQNVDQNQLLYTMLFSKLDQKPFTSTWLQNLIQTDFKSKTSSNQLLWAKWWLYGIIN